MKVLIIGLCLGLSVVRLQADDRPYLQGLRPASLSGEDPSSLFAAVIYRYHDEKKKNGFPVPPRDVQREEAKAVLRNGDVFWRGYQREKAYYALYAITLTEGEGFPRGNISDPSYGPNCLTAAEAIYVCNSFGRRVPDYDILIRELETNLDLNYYVLSGTFVIRMSRYDEGFEYFPRTICGYKYGDAKAAHKFATVDFSNAKIRKFNVVRQYERKLRRLLSLRSKILDERRNKRGAEPTGTRSKSHHHDPKLPANSN